MTDESHLKELLRAVAHDLKSSISANASLASMLSEHYAEVLDERGNKWLGMLSAESTLSISRLTALSAYAKLFDYSLEITKVSLAEIAQTCLSKINNESLERQLRPIKLVTHNLATISTDKPLITRFLSELMLNSLLHANPCERKHADDFTEHDAVECTLSYVSSVTGYSLIYADEGKILSTREIDYIQKPLSSLSHNKEHAHTVGLGISTLKRIAEILNASVVFEPGEQASGGLKVTLSVVDPSIKNTIPLPPKTGV